VSTERAASHDLLLVLLLSHRVLLLSHRARSLSRLSAEGFTDRGARSVVDTVERWGAREVNLQSAVGPNRPASTGLATEVR
jgi:hypothetical protein